MSRLILRALPALFWTATIWVASSRPWPGGKKWVHDILTALPQMWLVLFAIIPPDKVIHGLVFGLLAGLWWWALRPNLAATPVRHALWPWGLTAAYGGIDELHQGFVPGRSQDPFDCLADATGAALALAVCFAVAALQRKWQRRRGESAVAQVRPAASAASLRAARQPVDRLES